MKSPLYIIRKLIERTNRLFNQNLEGINPLMRIKTIKKNWVFDRALNMSYELKTDIGDSLFLRGTFEEKELLLLKNLAKSKVNPIIFDIGANIGFHSIEIAESNPKAKIYSFEPSISTRKILEYNIQNKHLENQVKIIPFAVSDSIGKANFYQTNDNAYSSLKDTQRKEVIDKIEVDVITIDEFMVREQLKNIDLIKIDVEGFDTEVIKGGLKTFVEFKPDIFIEIYKGVNSNPDPLVTINLLLDMGYKAFLIIDGKLTPFVVHSDILYNYFFSFHDFE
jgi:FkbM family methyltransferase